MATSKEKLSKVEELRRRAQARRAKQPQSFELFGVEDGFDPPIVIHRPTVDQVDAATQAQAKNMVVEALRISWGEDNYRRVADEFGDDWDFEMIQELANEVNAHFFGPGAGDVPGGSQAS